MLYLNQILILITPSQEELAEANQLQSEQLLDPFDSIILAQAITLTGKIITRDYSFLI